jgi:hypothetical protein
MKLQLEWVEVHLCEAYAQFLCDGIGTVWVCHLCQPLNFIKIGSILFFYCIRVNATYLSSVDNICSSNYIPLFQLREVDVWKLLDGHELMKNVGLDSGTYMYTKQRAMDVVGRLLETRRNPHGYTIPSSISSLRFNECCRSSGWMFLDHSFFFFFFFFSVSFLKIGS